MNIEPSQYALLIEDKLNQNDKNIQFRIYADAGKYQEAINQKEFINGVLIETTGDFENIKGIENITAFYIMELAVPENKIEDVRIALSGWASSIIGEVMQIGDTFLLMKPTLPITGYAKNTRIGSIVPLSVSIDIQSIKNGLLANMVAWKINGNDIQVLNASFNSTRTAENITIANKGIICTKNVYSSATISFLIPYTFDNMLKPAVLQVVRNILAGSKDELFEISRNDGNVAYNGKFYLNNGSLEEEAGKIVGINCTFTQAFEVVDGQ